MFFAESTVKVSMGKSVHTLLDQYVDDRVACMVIPKQKAFDQLEAGEIDGKELFELQRDRVWIMLESSRKESPGFLRINAPWREAATHGDVAPRRKLVAEVLSACLFKRRAILDI